MRRKALMLAAIAVGLSACAGHTVYMTGRTNGLTAQNKFRLKNEGDNVSFTLGAETYTGHWVYVEGGGALGIGTATTFSGTQSATTVGMSIGLPTTAGGTYIGSSPDGATLRCSYSFSEMNLKGVGTCVDSKGENYDVQIF
jgi:hypothetical protein